MSAKPALYISPGSCSLAPHILIREALPSHSFNLSSIDVKKGFPASHAHLNPKKRVPILIFPSSTTVAVSPNNQNPEIITENPAIMTAISQMAPEKHLLGATNLEIVRSYEWFAYLSGTLHGQGFGMLFRPGRFSDDESMYEEIKRKGRETTEGCFDTIEGKLKEGEKGVFAVGERFTAVDAYLFVFWRWGMAQGWDMRGRWKMYTKLVEGLGERESFREAVKMEGIESYLRSGAERMYCL